LQIPDNSPKKEIDASIALPEEMLIYAIDIDGKNYEFVDERVISSEESD
jgi:hypothetical protein